MTVLTIEHIEKQKQFMAFVYKEIIPYADKYDKEEFIPAELLKKLGKEGYWGAIIPVEYGGSDMDMITYGLLSEEISRGSASVLSLITVHGMLTKVILKWGTSSQKEKWLPQLASGKKTGAFALSEPDIGSDAKNINTRAVFSEGSYILTGKKKWISFGQAADLFLIVAQCDGGPAAFLLEKDTPGFSIKPIKDMLGFRSAMLAELNMEQCKIPEENLVGTVGFGFSHVAGAGLDNGRYTIAWGSVGIARACLEACIKYTNERKQFGVYLKEHQLIQQKIADMVTNIKAARLLCYNAGILKNADSPESIMETCTAKYFSSKIALKAAADAVQIHGANGCSAEYPVQRYFRDAKIMEIIEGSNQMQQILIARHAYQE